MTKFYLNKLQPDEPLGETAVVVLVFYPTCSVLNYMRIALTLVVIELCASNVRLSPADIYMYMYIFLFVQLQNRHKKH